MQASAEQPDAHNSQAPHTIDAIYLRPLPGLTNGHRVMNLASGQPLTATKVTELPVTEHVIKSVENLAEEQDIKSLKVTGKNKIPLLPADWIAGVDYEPCDGQCDEADEDDEKYRQFKPSYGYEEELDDDDKYAPVSEDEIEELIKDAANPIVPRDNTNEAETDQVETIEQNDSNEADEAATETENVEVINEPAEEPAIDIEPEESSDDKPEDQEQDEVSEPVNERPSRTITKPEIWTHDKLGGRSGNYAQRTARMRAKLQKRHHLFAQSTSKLQEE